jgi:hypothetical protein
MKNYLLPLLAAFLAASSVRAALITYTDTNNVTTGGGTFTFSQFNPSLGTLTAIDLIIQSSTLQGSINITRTTGSRTFTDLNAALSIDPASGFSGYDSNALSYDRTPSGTFTINATNSSRLINVTGTTQSLIGGSPVTFGINPSDFGSYIGVSTVSFDSFILLGDNNTGSGEFSVDSSNLLSPTSMALLYTYSVPPAPVPEPGQVAASLLLLGGIGTYFLIKRRRSSSASA